MSVRLIGGEMTVWSDLDSRHGPAPANGPFAVSGRTLVAGPHSPEFLDGLPAEGLTLLVRGLSDADRLAGRYPQATVLCGSLEKMAAEPAYDTVMALDGLGRLRSAEDETVGPGWAEDLAVLAAVLRPGGRLVLGVENLFGLHRILAVAPPPSDADWGVAERADPDRPASPAAVRAALAALDLDVTASYARFGSALLGDDLLAAPDISGFVQGVVRAALQTDESLLADPRRLAAGALRAGIGTSLAPDWVVVAGPGIAAAGGVAAAGFVGDDEIRLHDGEWIFRDVPVPIGRPLDELLLAASVRRDLPAMRELLTAWQNGPAAGVPAGRIVAGPDGTLTPLAAGRSPLEALGDLAATMLAEGHADFWPAPADRAELAALLAAMAGNAIDPATVPAGPPPRESVRELRMDRDRLAREVAEARAKQDWYEQMLRGREAELKRVRRINAVLAATVPGKAAKAGYGGLRAGKRAAKGVLRRLRG